MEVLLKRFYKQVCDLSDKQKIEKPEVWVVSDTVAVAGWHQNSIYIEQKALDIIRSMGKDSTKALAFVLGHELAHHFDLHGKNIQTNYARRDMDSILEDQADLKSAFWCYLNGHPVKSVMRRLLDNLYAGYGFNSKLKGYPNLSQRQTAVERVQKRCDTLVHIFNCAKVLIAAHRYEEAIICLEHIEKYLGIQFYEVLNLLGVAHLLAVVDSKGDYNYPVLIHQNIRRMNAFKRGGPEDTSVVQKHLKKAMQYFDKAGYLQAEDETIIINKIAIHLYLNNQKEVKKMIEVLKNEYHKAFYTILLETPFDINDTTLEKKLKSIPDTMVSAWAKEIYEEKNSIMDLRNVSFNPPKFSKPRTVLGNGFHFNVQLEDYILESVETTLKIYLGEPLDPSIKETSDKIYEPDGACWMTYKKGSMQSVVVFKKAQKVKTYYIKIE